MHILLILKLKTKTPKTAEISDLCANCYIHKATKQPAAVLWSISFIISGPQIWGDMGGTGDMAGYSGKIQRDTAGYSGIQSGILNKKIYSRALVICWFLYSCS